MRETRQSGSEGGARFNPLSLPLSIGRRSATGECSNKYKKSEAAVLQSRSFFGFPSSCRAAQRVGAAPL